MTVEAAAWEITGNPYLAGLYEPVDEERVDEGLEVIGEIPADLDGVYVRNGPNPRFAPPGRYHWFDGDGMVHALNLQGGKAHYRNRFVATDKKREEDAAGHRSSGRPPCAPST